MEPQLGLAVPLSLAREAALRVLHLVAPAGATIGAEPDRLDQRLETNPRTVAIHPGDRTAAN